MTEPEIEAIDAAIARAETKHPGTADMPDGTGKRCHRMLLSDARRDSCAAIRLGNETYALALIEEAFEVAVETDPARIDAELLDVIAVAMRWRRKLAREMEAKR